MDTEERELRTDRLILRTWRENDRENFIAMHQDADVMSDLGGSYDREESSRRFDRYCSSWPEFGYGRWCVCKSDNRFLGYVGIQHKAEMGPLGPHNEIGWRLNRQAWGKGYACEAAIASLSDAFGRCGLTEIVAYTGPENFRSQSIINKLGFRRYANLDFKIPWEPLGEWQGCVWKLFADDFQ